MSYEIKTERDTLYIEFSGVLNALDLICLNQSQAYQTGLKKAAKMMLDFSQISGSQLTQADTHGLLMLGKRDSHKVLNIQLLIVTGKTNSQAIAQLGTRIFAQSSWQVSIIANRHQADKLCNV